ncbi:hypothetical protein PG994_012204 [Apiospora phragmitis]|uniref:Amidoligase enzyme n=1 Tax=Apiospora phragmitis TaxID=2905665 RepID=A0ABR1TV00_9PEZI
MQGGVESPAPGETLPETLPPLPLPRPLTYGVEIEGIVHYLDHDEKDPFDGVEDLPKPTRLPADLPKDELPEKIIHNLMAKTLADHGIPTKEVRITCYPPKSVEHYMAQERLKQHGQWKIVPDVTIQPPYSTEHKFMGFEINSSVEIESPESFEVLKFVINCITREHRVLLNESCGLHIHVGNGAENFSLGSIRRIGCLLWSAGPLIGTLHPPWRRANLWCMPIRTSSHLAVGNFNPTLVHDEARDPGRGGPNCAYVGGDMRFGERSTLWREAHQDPETIALYDETRKETGTFVPFLDDEVKMTYQPKSSEFNPDFDKYNEEIFQKKVSYTAPNHAYAFAIPTDEELVGGSSGTSSDTDSPEPSEASEGCEWPPLLAAEEMASQRQIANRVAALPTERFHKPHAPRRFTNRPRCTGANFTGEDLKRWCEERSEYLSCIQESSATANEKPAALLPGVVRLLSAQSPCEVAQLLHRAGDGGGKCNYNFAAYRCIMIEEEDRHTIEFREAESSLDSPWVATWAKICIGLIKFAVNAPADAFMRVITNCDLGERGREYDVVDLLSELGLFAEAAAAAERMWQNRDVWHLTFADADGGDPDDDPDTNDTDGGDGPNPGDKPNPGNDPSGEDSCSDDEPGPDPGNDSEKPEEPDPEELDSQEDSDPSKESIESIDQIDGLHSIDGDSTSSSSSDGDEDDDASAKKKPPRASPVIGPQLPTPRTNVGLGGQVFARTWENQKQQAASPKETGKSPGADVESPIQCGIQ